MTVTNRSGEYQSAGSFEAGVPYSATPSVIPSVETTVLNMTAHPLMALCAAHKKHLPVEGKQLRNHHSIMDAHEQQVSLTKCSVTSKHMSHWHRPQALKEI